MKTVVIMQPCFFPWIGLFEQIRLADVFVHFDDAQFSKGGLTNRVKIKSAGGAKWLTVLLINLRLGQPISEVRMDRTHWRRSHLDSLRQAYGDAPFVHDMLDIVETVYGEPHVGIAALDIAGIEACCRYLGIDTEFVRSSDLGIDASGSERVLRIVQQLGGDVYVTGHGAANYLDHEAFDAAGVRVEYMDYQRREYSQLHGPFDPHLSVLDAIANCGPGAIEYICSATVPWMEFVQDDGAQFVEQGREQIERMGADDAMRDCSRGWMHKATELSYTHHFTWMGRPIIQLPQDMIAMQEIIWSVRPQLIIETGIARGGSLIYYASLLELFGGDGRVLGIDVDIRVHNRKAIDKHPMRKRIDMIEGSSIDDGIIEQVRSAAAGKAPIIIVLDSNHTHDHVLGELHAYASLVTKGSYLVVFDTAIDNVPPEVLGDRPWGPGDNPKTALRVFLDTTDRFEIDASIHNKLMITVAPDGYLRCIGD